MLDYEINGYEVKVLYKDEKNLVTYRFQQEEEAIEFIKLNRHDWKECILYQLRHAIIDF